MAHLFVTGAADFAKAAVTDPKLALKDVADGVLHVEKSGFEKYFAPAGVAIGASAIAVGIAAADPVTVLLGAFNLTMGLGYYRTLGEERREKIEAAESATPYHEIRSHEVVREKTDVDTTPKGPEARL